MQDYISQFSEKSELRESQFQEINSELQESYQKSYLRLLHLYHAVSRKDEMKQSQSPCLFEFRDRLPHTEHNTCLIISDAPQACARIITEGRVCVCVCLTLLFCVFAGLQTVNVDEN